MEKSSDQLIIDGLYQKLRQYSLIILESQLKNHQSSTCSYVAAGIKNSITARESAVELNREGKRESFEMDPWMALKKFRSEKKRWLFGFLGYDLKNHIENLNSANPGLYDIPDLFFFEPEILVKIENGETEFLAGDFNQLDDQVILTDINGAMGPDLQPLLQKQAYIKNVNTIQERIFRGDFYEMNYTFPLRGTYSGDPYWLYSRMREVNPVPFGALILNDNFSVCSASPERFLRKNDDIIQTEPIKGTAPRSRDVEQDLINRQELLNEKNRAENLMIVDLVRHDLSKVSKPGSVKVSRLYDVNTFGTVHQLISTIQSIAENGIDAVDIIRSCFPMGSMTGAPKIEVMKTTDELEIYRRGIYSGAIGYITPEDDFDFNVVIRTAILQGNSLYYPVGGAITSDSDPDSEWSECMIKSRSLTEIFSKEADF